MGKFPFSVYDFFAYLSSGTVLLIAADYVWKLGLLSQKEFNPFFALSLVILAYVIGHIVAHFSSLLFEQLIVFRVLGQPSRLLLADGHVSPFYRFIFPGYHRPLSRHTQERVRAQAANRDCKDAGEALFQHAYPLVSANPRFQERLDDFRNQYGFARNMSLAFLAAALTIFIARYSGVAQVRLRWAVLLLIGSIALFYRYLKFFRQYSYELLLRYSELPTCDRQTISEGD